MGGVHAFVEAVEQVLVSQGVPLFVIARQHFAQRLVCHGVQAAEYHYVTDLCEAMLVGQEHQQFLSGIEAAAGQAQPDLAGQRRQVGGDRVFVGAGADAQGGRTTYQQIDPLDAAVLGHRAASVGTMAVAHAMAVGVDGAGAIASFMHVKGMRCATAAQ